ncbi:MAG: radical SAM protein [Myxococcales bacterium]|nr:radical SAM protein [Myxococcales bacterium]
MRFLLVNPPVLAADELQVYAYADVFPYGLHQIATLLRRQGHHARLLDMMAYLEGDYDRVLRPETRFARKPCGDHKTRNVLRDVHLYGRDFAWLDARLAEMEPPDEVLVTCCITFNWEPAHRVVAACRRAFPRARIRFGGFYPTAFPEHAARSGADEVFRGRWAEADRVFPRLAPDDPVPRIWLFRLVAGCRYRCSFCVNASSAVEVLHEPRAAAAELRRVHREYGITKFCNWDPNVMLAPEALGGFLDAVARGGPPLALRFDMGIAPHLLTRDLAARMRAAGTVAMTIPFESADPSVMRRMGKPYRVEDAMRAIDLAADAGFDRAHLHCTFLVGLRDEDLGALFRTYLLILRSGGKPMPFPLTPTPGTREYDRHAPYLAGKDLDLLNGHLWPALGPASTVRLYDRVLRVVSALDVESAREQAARLPLQVRELFEREARAVLRPGAPHRRAATRAEQALPVPPLSRLPGWLHALCASCADRDLCTRAASRREPDVAECFRERRGVETALLAVLFDDLRRTAGLDDPRLPALEERMWAHLERLQQTCANTFEPSASWDGRRWSLYRFSYSFHDARPDRWSEDARTLVDWTALVEPRAARSAQRILRLAAPPLARQLLFGLDAETGGRMRLKIYFRLERGMAEAKQALLATLAGAGWNRRLRVDPAGLAIAAFDFGPRGVAAVKLYFEEPRVPAPGFVRRFRAGTFYPVATRLRRIRAWEDVLSIARVTPTNRRRPPVFVEANVNCLRNDLTIGDAAAVFARARPSPQIGPLAALFARHPLALSSITFPYGRGAKANLYYRLVG